MLWAGSLAPMFTQFDRPALFPAGDLAASESDLVLTLDLPGLTAEDLSIEVHNDALTVRGERPRPEVGEGVTYLYAQRPYGTFEHRVELPKGVDPAAITASIDNCELSLIIPKPEPLKPKRIAIGAPSEDRQLESAAV